MFKAIFVDTNALCEKVPDFISFYFVYSFVSDLLVLVLGLLIRRKFFWQIENLNTRSKKTECILKVKLFQFCFSHSIPNLNRKVRFLRIRLHKAFLGGLEIPLWTLHWRYS